MKIHNLEGLLKAKQRGITKLYPPKKPKLLVGMATCGLANGAREVFDFFRSKARATSWNGLVEKTGCIGLCYQEPLVDLVIPGKPRLTYNRVDLVAAEKIWEELWNGDIPETSLMAWNDTDMILLDGGPRKLHQGETESFMRRFPSYAELDFLKYQQHIAMRNCGLLDPDNLDHYIARGGYFSLQKALTAMQPDEVIEEIIRSGLRGRGGGGFPAGIKWRSCRKAKGAPKYVLCNADEGNPGTYTDRGLLESDPHSILEGMLIGAYAIGSTEGYIYVRAEYPLAVETMQRAISAAREAGLLGKDILGTGFDFDMEISLGGGAYVCGESTALMASIEGKPGEPRAKYTHTAEKGLWDRPSNLNNVETWANVPVIISKGADWYNMIGTKKSTGTKMFSLVGKVNRVGLVEVPMGITIREMVNAVGGGVPSGGEFKAIQTGGPSGGCIPKDCWDLPLDFESLTHAGSMMGSGGMIVMDQSICMVDLARHFIDFLMDESCGKCVPCRLGLKRMHTMLERFTEGRGTIEDLDEMKSLARAIQDAALCALGGSAPNPVLSTIRYFRDEFEAHILDKRCPAKVCKRLITYSINSDACTGCAHCSDVCPTGAIVSTNRKTHRIETSLCIKCGVCAGVCEAGAIEVI
ncbi:MAG: NADH-quinone oxidoreductase subunit NuoF [Syntrophobacter sp.]